MKLKSAIFSLAVFFLFLYFSTAFSEDINPEMFGKKSSELYKNKDYDAIISLCNQTLAKKDPSFKSFAGVYYIRAYAKYEQEDYDNAILDCNTAIKLKPEYSYAYYLLSLCYEKTGQIDQAINAAHKALLLDEDISLFSKRYDEICSLKNQNTDSQYDLFIRDWKFIKSKYKDKVTPLRNLVDQRDNLEKPPFAVDFNILSSPPMEPKGKIYLTMGTVANKKGDFYICELENANRTKTLYFTFIDKVETERGKNALSELHLKQYFLILGRLTKLAPYQTIIGETKHMPFFEALHIEPCMRKYYRFSLYGYIPIEPGEKLQ